jgi:hypothetical protein
VKTLDISGYFWWDIVDGTHMQSTAWEISTGKEKGREGNSSETESISAKAQPCEKANLTICPLLAKNWKEDAAEFWKALKELNEGKAITDHSILLASLTKFPFDNLP